MRGRGEAAGAARRGWGWGGGRVGESARAAAQCAVQQVRARKRKVVLYKGTINKIICQRHSCCIHTQAIQGKAMPHKKHTRQMR